MKTRRRLTGVPVDWIKFQAYLFSAFTASVAALLLLGYNGSALNALGTGYELRVIAATVIGGASLMGGYGTAFGAVVGSAFLEVIRNALLMAGIDSNWQGAFVGIFIVLAVLLGMQTSGTSLRALVQNWLPAKAPLGKPIGGRLAARSKPIGRRVNEKRTDERLCARIGSGKSDDARRRNW